MFRIAYCGGGPAGDGQVLSVLEQALEEIGRTSLIGYFFDPNSLLAALSREMSAYDLVMLDLRQQEGEMVMKALERLPGPASGLPVILLDGVAAAAPADGVLRPRYGLRRPVSCDRLKEVLLKSLPPPLLLRQARSLQMVPLGQILYIEVLGHQIKVHTLSRQVLSASGPLSRIQRETPEGQFLRCHKSYLVNLANVEGIRRYQILLAGGRSIPTSKKDYNQIRQAVLQYFAGRAQSGPSPAIQEIKSGPPL